MSDVPPLRFPEFSGEWEMCKLEDCVDFLDGLRKPIKSEDRKCEMGLYPYYGASGIIDYIDEYIFDGDYILLSEDGANILDRNYRVAFFAKGKIWVNNHAHVLHPHTNIDIDFLSEALERLNYVVYNTGTTMPKLNQEVCRKIRLYIPPIKEQNKIGALLSLLNERIATQNKVIEKLKSLIKGIIHQTKSIGFAHNTWQKTELRKVLQERNEKNANGYDVCSVSVTQGVVNQIEYLGRSFAAKDTQHYNVVKYGDIVYTKSPTGDFPYGIVKRSNIKSDVAVSPLYGVYKPVNDYIGIILHFYFLEPNNALNYLHPLIQKGAKNTINITNGRFLENSIPLPKKEDETKRLAWILTSIQSKIILEQNLLQSYLKQKQYLLRQMFI